MVKASSGPWSRENGHRGGVLHGAVPTHSWGQRGGLGASQPAAWTAPAGPCERRALELSLPHEVLFFSSVSPTALT